MKTNGIRIGEVTERTGLSVPTLRYYDSVGLISPSGRTPEVSASTARRTFAISSWFAA